jgi:hypothetical protein
MLSAKAGQISRHPQPITDRMHALLVTRADALEGCTEGSGSGAKLVGIESGVISGLNLASQIRRLGAAVGDNANDDRYRKCSGW